MNNTTRSRNQWEQGVKRPYEKQPTKFREWFLIAETLSFSKGEKKEQLPVTQGEMRRALDLPLVIPASLVWWKECEVSVKTWNLQFTTFLFFFFTFLVDFPSFILLRLQFVASGLVLWLKQDLLTNLQTEEFCRSSTARGGEKTLDTSQEALLKS